MAVEGMARTKTTWETLRDMMKATGQDEGHSTFEKLKYFFTKQTTVAL